MNMAEYIQALETYVASRKLNLGDGESVLSLLYEAHGDIKRMYDDQIKADFAEIYQALNGMPLQEMDWIVNPVCALCRDHESNPRFVCEAAQRKTIEPDYGTGYRRGLQLK